MWDYKITVNPGPMSTNTHYLSLKSYIVLTTLTNGCKFIKLDLSAAYQQMLLDEESTKLVTVNTHLGLFRYYHLPFGVPAIFQHAMDTLLQRVTNVICYIDDLLVTGETDEEHLQHLESFSAIEGTRDSFEAREVCILTVRSRIPWLMH